MLMLLPAVIVRFPVGKEVKSPVSVAGATDPPSFSKRAFVAVTFAAKFVKLFAALMLMLPPVREAFCKSEDWMLPLVRAVSPKPSW